MTIILNNLQRRFRINCKLLREQSELAKSILTATRSGHPPSATITLTSNFHVKVLNTKYALLRKTTDVLSFRLADVASRSTSSFFDEANIDALRNAPYLDVETGKLIQPDSDYIDTDAITKPFQNHLGNVFLAVPYCHRIAITRSMRLHEYLLLATVHGIAHLVGHVHSSKAQRTQMKAAEVEVLNELRHKYDFANSVESSKELHKPFMPMSYLP